MNLRNRLINMFYESATSSKKVRIFFTPVGPLLVFTFVTLFIAASLWLDKFLGFPKLLSALWSMILSMPIFAIGLFLVLWSVLQFIKAKGTPVPFNPPPRLVSTGLYAYVRNPMLTGAFILLFGLGVLLRSISLVFIFIPLLILLSVWELYRNKIGFQVFERSGQGFKDSSGQVKKPLKYLTLEPSIP